MKSYDTSKTWQIILNAKLVSKFLTVIAKTKSEGSEIPKNKWSQICHLTIEQKNTIVDISPFTDQAS